MKFVFTRKNMLYGFLVVLIVLICIIKLSSIGLPLTQQQNNRPCVDNVCGNNSKLLPVSDPAFNLRELIKQMLLLEDHLFEEQKLCIECCNKHFLMCDGLAAEGVTLDNEKKYTEVLEEAAQICRKLQDDFNRDSSPEHAKDVGMELRKERKFLMKVLYTNQ